MDLLSRLIAGSIASSPSKQKVNTPQERLQACKRICTSLQQIWRNGTRLSDDNAASGHVVSLLNRLNTLLQDESRKAAPHSCLLHTATTQIYIIVTKLALSSDSPAIINEATQFFHLLINGEVEGMIDSKIFARALIDLVRRSTIFATIVVDEQGEAELVELLFEIATKIRLDPDMLPGWFYPERDQGRNKSSGLEARRSQFPLFYLLVDYVHHDGPTGDFARTGLLYLTETASRSKPLEKWMIESDLAPQMASGLCALYSRLSRQAPVLGDGEKALPIIAFSDPSIGDANSPESQRESQQSVKSFLSYLAFWQDTLNHCKSIEVKDTLLDHFQVLFVQQLLYPSLLESSDVAGGSTSAVILHLYRMLNLVEYQPLLKRMLQYLLASTKTETKQAQPKHSRARVSFSRRQSMEQLASMIDQVNTPSPDLFNLLDLLVLSLHSKHAQTVNSSLKLITIILRRHHPCVLQSLFAVQPIAPADNLQSLDDFNGLLMQFFALSEAVAVNMEADQSYEAALNDSRILLERHSCLLSRADPTSLVSSTSDFLTITTDCRLFSALSDLLETFFANDTVTNITLTETLVALATCEFVCMRKWVEPVVAGQTLLSASIYPLLSDLVDHMNTWKRQFDNWDLLVLHQKLTLVESNNLPPGTDARPQLLPSKSVNATETNPKIRSTDPPSTPTRSITPRRDSAASPAFASIGRALASPPKFGMSPSKKILVSPLHTNTSIGESIDTITPDFEKSPAVLNPTIFNQQVQLPSKTGETFASRTSSLVNGLQHDKQAPETSTLDEASSASGDAVPIPQERMRKTATLGHIVTNAIILQEFLLELAALLQIRGALFDEVDMR